MALAGIELTFLVGEISKKTEGYYVNNIYSINQDSILFKLHHPQKADLFLVVSSIGMWLSSIKIDQIEENKLVRRLRSDLLRLKITKIEQLGVERIAYLTFSGFDKEFVLICEFFGEGNIILCNKDLKILALLHSVEVRHRELRVGTTYMQPPQKGLNIFCISEKDFDELKSISTPIVRWLGRTFGLPAKYAEEILRSAKINFDAPAITITPDNIKSIISAAKTITQKITKGPHEPVIIKTQDGFEVFPIKIDADYDYEKIPSFMEGLDRVFSKILVEEGKTTQSGSFDKKIADLQSRIDEQNKAIFQVKEKSERISNIAKVLFALGTSSTVTDPGIVENLRSHNAEIIKERGLIFIKIGDEKIQVSQDSSIPAIASILFDESKRQAAATASIESLKTKNQKELEKLRTQANVAKESISFTKIKKREWFERYRWFYTSDGLLAIGGRDSSSNSALIRKQLGKNDKVFHAEIFGSPFFILKEVPEPLPFDSLNEAAHATVCFSRAWRETMYGMSAYWINPTQVKKAAPSGQFLARGSFVLEGHKNFIRASTLKLAVGILEKDGDYMVCCGPPEPIKKRCLCYGIIEPGGSEMTETAKRLRLEFIRINEDVGKQFGIDDFVRVLPAGESHITEQIVSKF